MPIKKKFKGWVFMSNGGPNDEWVGGQEKSRGKAFGRLESSMKATGATEGWIIRADHMKNFKHSIIDMEEVRSHDTSFFDGAFD